MVNMELAPIFYHEGIQEAMSNEELAVMIQSGERDKLPELWKQVKRFVWKQANRWAAAVGATSGATAEDFYQSGFLALVDAVERFEPSAGAFTTILSYALKSEFSITARVRTKHQRMDPLRDAVSLDMPTNAEADGDTLEDFIEDPQAVRAFEQVEGQHEAIERVLHSLTEDQRAVIRARYYRGLTLEQTERVLGMTRGEAHRTEQKALRALRRPRISRTLKAYLD